MFSLLNTMADNMGPAPMVKKSFSHYAPRPLQQPQMPDMKQVKRSVCNHIRHFSLNSTAAIPPRIPSLYVASYRLWSGATGSHLIATVNCHSSFSFHGAPWTNSSVRPYACGSFVPTALTPPPIKSARSS